MTEFPESPAWPYHLHINKCLLLRKWHSLLSVLGMQLVWPFPVTKDRPIEFLAEGQVGEGEQKWQSEEMDTARPG